MKNDLPILYARTSTGAIQTWKIEVEGNKFRTVTGQLNGQLIRHGWQICESKNEGKKNATTGEEQAYKEAESKWKKKLKSGGYFKTVEEIDNDLTFVEPILAKSYKDYKEKVDLESGKWGMQVKFNGLCCIASVKGCYSRKGEKFISVPHIEKSLASLFDKYPDAVLHGELFNDDYREKLNEIVKLCRKTVDVTEQDIKESEKYIRFYIYDGYCESQGVGELSSYENRKAWIDKTVINEYDYCCEVKTISILSKEQLDNFFGERIERGDEGVILRFLSMPYEHKRSKNLLKYKPLDDSEGVIIDIKEGTGNWAGTGKIITLKWNDKVFDATFKGTHEQCVQFLKDKDEWIGKEVKFLYNGLTGKLTPNYARIDIDNCSIEK